MCQISSQLKLCTCNGKSIDREQPHWILYRKTRIEKIYMGSVLFEVDPDPALTEKLENQLRKRLNEPDVFDFLPDLQEGDQILIDIGKRPGSEKRMDFVYKFQNHQWHPSGFGPFEILNHFSEVLEGKIELPS